MTEQSIARLNELAHLKKQRPLTPEETAEQAALRLEYLAAIRQNLQNQLDHTTVLYPDGHTEKLHKKYTPGQEIK